MDARIFPTETSDSVNSCPCCAPTLTTPWSPIGRYIDADRTSDRAVDPVELVDDLRVAALERFSEKPLVGVVYRPVRDLCWQRLTGAVRLLVVQPTASSRTRGPTGSPR
ncbi:hypothetical protein C8039_07940 [Halogeometricum sp. wsp3]|nr:hypothetical protein C8039_07940 [Halogeometricum sp. wsp3]